jgi:hypothetical protein
MIKETNKISQRDKKYLFIEEGVNSLNTSLTYPDLSISAEEYENTEILY